MARFAYKMQNILNIKLRLESQAKTSYAEAAGKVSKEEEKLKQFVMRLGEYESQAKQLVSDKLDIPAMKRCNTAIEVTKEQIKNQIIALKVAERNLEAARNRLQIAIQERKTHEKLKENAFEVFKQEMNLEEKKEIDELVSFNYNDNDKETGDE